MNQIRIVSTGLLYLLIFASGFWLSRTGRPFNGVILTIHKLISLAALAFLVITTIRLHPLATLGALELVAPAITGLLFLGTIVTGGLLSTDQRMPAAILTMHRITPFLTVLSTAVTLYLLVSRR